MSKIIKILEAFALLLLVIAGFTGGLLYAHTFGMEKVNNLFEKDYTPEEIPKTEQEIKNNCRNLDVRETSKCLRDNVKTFFNYSITNKSYNDLETLKERGGDCYNYALFYERIGSELGFNTTINLQDAVEELNKSKHGWALIWNEEEDYYCKIDQRIVECFNK